MPPVPPIVFATPTVDIENGNDAVAMVVDAARWESDRIVECSVIFRRESAYSANGRVDTETTALLLANNSLHYGRTADLERFFVAYDEVTPIGIGFGSLGTPQSWMRGRGPVIPIPNVIPIIGGRQIVTFKDDIPLTPAVDARVFVHGGSLVLPWDALELTPAGTRRLYVSTPNHLFDFINRNPSMSHVDQAYGERGFRQLVELPSPHYTTAEDFARGLPDESSSSVREAVRSAAQRLFHRPWLF
jgi:hypothetical protein